MDDQPIPLCFPQKHYFLPPGLDHTNHGNIPSSFQESHVWKAMVYRLLRVRSYSSMPIKEELWIGDRSCWESSPLG